ncbi:hypothetical protein ElyMa_005616200 [Elysia marginata]|uniref:Uncharacterized protein n=1 Tax=Elysia marginata TaxID=1093978 RepID=A0AAV4F6X8_9GAST|nr:hypothetical protein ElyMa_005616200 [Elysia marginata]
MNTVPHQGADRQRKGNIDTMRSTEETKRRFSTRIVRSSKEKLWKTSEAEAARTKQAVPVKGFQDLSEFEGL